MAESQLQTHGHVRMNDDDLPASFLQDYTLTLPTSQFEVFLASDLSVQRIERIKEHLWLAGRPYFPRSLSTQGVLNRKVIPTTEASLHLVWTSGRIFIKPLPAYLCSDWFWDQYLAVQKASKIKGPALGLLYSYLALVPTELDFALAQEANLLPRRLEWPVWRGLAQRILTQYPSITTYREIPRRYVYGELRFGRLNKIYRYRCFYLLHGFSPLMGASTYADFFKENLGAVTAVTVYIVIVLSAMSVGLSVDELEQNWRFQEACYGFAVFSMMAPVVVVGIVVMVFVPMFLANWSRTIIRERARFAQLYIEPPQKSKRKAKHKDQPPKSASAV